MYALAHAYATGMCVHDSTPPPRRIEKPAFRRAFLLVEVGGVELLKSVGITAFSGIKSECVSELFIIF